MTQWDRLIWAVVHYTANTPTFTSPAHWPYIQTSQHFTFANRYERNSEVFFVSFTFLHDNNSVSIKKSYLFIFVTYFDQPSALILECILFLAFNGSNKTDTRLCNNLFYGTLWMCLTWQWWTFSAYRHCPVCVFTVPVCFQILLPVHLVCATHNL